MADISMNLIFDVNCCCASQVDALKELVEAYPDAYYIHTHRSGDTMLDSFALMLERFRLAGLLNRYKGQVRVLWIIEILRLAHCTHIKGHFF